MTEEQKNKREFCRGKLFALLLEIDSQITFLDYGIVYGHEIVDITWKQGYSKRIEVTADSLKALAVDVLKHI